MATGEADALIGGDLVVSAGAKTLGLTSAGRTGAVVNSHEIITGDFTRDTEFALPTDRLTLSLEARLQDRVDLFDASDLAKATLGDAADKADWSDLLEERPCRVRVAAIAVAARIESWDERTNSTKATSSRRSGERGRPLS